ncbi:putative polyubiquitin [Tothia fuscella]|uniref:Polyubiquitin n=1 Tax=Tothia fuscella TaxID=1048955 RepID=A0A9P4TVK5_9PEZI|nr:putative polyubiquitin [Tothia fuscella]
MRSNSITSLSSVSSNEEETMQVFVKNVAGNIIPLQVPPSTTISTLTSLLTLRTNIPQNDLRLVFAGKHLTPSATLSESLITPDTTLHLALPLRGGMAKKPTCDYKKDTADKCKEKIPPIIGDCGFCGGHFCSKHRLLESHNCPNLEDCKKESHERNAERLNSERTVAIKGI